MKKVFNKIEEHLLKDSILIEAYSGIGTIGLSLLDQVKSCVMIESNKENIEMSKLIIDQNHINQIELVEARAEHVIDKYPGDVLLVDPPRQGLLQSFVDKVLLMQFKQMIYVSCDVKTLVRDLVLLSEVFEVTDIYPIRMFHHTISIETLVILKRKNSERSDL